jgi:hypothetical protein
MREETLAWVCKAIREMEDDDLDSALKNLGCDITCGRCAMGFFTGHCVDIEHDFHCAFKDSQVKVEITFGKSE